MRCEDDEGMEAVAAMLEQLALEIRATINERNAGENGNARRMPREIRNQWQKGALVRVIIRDKYYGRTGTLMGRRGTQYWDIKLDSHDGECSRVIYKKQSSLQIIDNH